MYTVNTDMHSPFVISQNDPRPLYQQVKDQLRHRVAIGVLKPMRTRAVATPLIPDAMGISRV